MAGAPRPFVPAHRCHAVGCSVEVPPRLLMCRSHWRMVPRRLQICVWAEYRPGQERDKRPSARYLAVMHAAIAVVASKEQRHGEAGEARERADLFRRAVLEHGGRDPLAGIDLPEPMPSPSEAP